MPADASRRPSPTAARRRALIALVSALIAVQGVRLLGATRTPISAPPTVLRVDPNTAPPAVLEALPRVGPVIAGRIVAAREDAPFIRLDDLDRRVRGVGPVTIAAVRPYLRFDGETSPHPKDR